MFGSDRKEIKYEKEVAIAYEKHGFVLKQTGFKTSKELANAIRTWANAIGENYLRYKTQDFVRLSEIYNTKNWILSNYPLTAWGTVTFPIIKKKVNAGGRKYTDIQIQNLIQAMDPELAKLIEKLKTLAPETTSPQSGSNTVNSTVNVIREKEIGSDFAATYRNCLAKCPTMKVKTAAAFELIPLLFVLADYAVTSTSFDRRKTADYIQTELKRIYNFDNTKAQQFQARTDLYGKAIRNVVSIKGVWLMGNTDPFIKNPLTRCVAIFGDLVAFPEHASRYETSGFPIGDITYVTDVANNCILPMAGEIRDFFMRIISNDSEVNEAPASVEEPKQSSNVWEGYDIDAFNVPDEFEEFVRRRRKNGLLYDNGIRISFSDEQMEETSRLYDMYGSEAVDKYDKLVVNTFSTLDQKISDTAGEIARCIMDNYDEDCHDAGLELGIDIAEDLIRTFILHNAFESDWYDAAHMGFKINVDGLHLSYEAPLEWMFEDYSDETLVSMLNMLNQFVEDGVDAKANVEITENIQLIKEECDILTIFFDEVQRDVNFNALISRLGDEKFFEYVDKTLQENYPEDELEIEETEVCVEEDATEEPLVTSIDFMKAAIDKAVELSYLEGVSGFPNIPEIMMQADTVCNSIIEGAQAAKINSAQALLYIPMWCAYAGMGAVKLWDLDWNKLKKKGIYLSLIEARGFKEMDEHVTELIGREYSGNDNDPLRFELQNLTLFVSKHVTVNGEFDPNKFRNMIKGMYLYGMVYEMDNLGMH